MPRILPFSPWVTLIGILILHKPSLLTPSNPHSPACSLYSSHSGILPFLWRAKVFIWGSFTQLFPQPTMFPLRKHCFCINSAMSKIFGILRECSQLPPTYPVNQLSFIILIIHLVAPMFNTLQDCYDYLIVFISVWRHLVT